MGREEGLLDSVVEPEILVDIIEEDNKEENGELELVVGIIRGGGKEEDKIELVGIIIGGGEE